MGGAAAPSADPFAAVPNAPHFHAALPEESTSAIMRASGAKKRNWGAIVALAAVLVLVLAAVTYGGLKAGGVIQVRERQSVAVPGSNASGLVLDADALAALVGGGRGAKKGETVTAEASAKGGGEKAVRKARGSGDLDDVSMLMPKDTDTQGAIVKGAKRDDAQFELTPEQLALIQASRGDQPGAKRPGGAGAPNLVNDDAFDVNRKGAGDGPDPKLVSKKIADAQPGLSNCISTALRRNPNLRLGKVVITATIGGSGVVTKAVFSKPAVGESDVGECLRKVVKSIVFPPFDGESTDVEIPLTIGSSG